MGTVDLGTYLDRVGAAGDVPAAARLVLPDYSYFQGYAQSGQGAEVVGPVRVVGGLFAAGVGQSTTLAAGAMLTTAPDYLEAADAGVRRRYQVLEWKESSGG